MADSAFRVLVNLETGQIEVEGADSEWVEETIEKLLQRFGGEPEEVEDGEEPEEEEAEEEEPEPEPEPEEKPKPRSRGRSRSS